MLGCIVLAVLAYFVADSFAYDPNDRIHKTLVTAFLFLASILLVSFGILFIIFKVTQAKQRKKAKQAKETHIPPEKRPTNYEFSSDPTNEGDSDDET
jgi:uncharacterized membrane protein